MRNISMFNVYSTLFRTSVKLPNVPIIGAKEGEFFPLLRARWRNLFDMEPALREAYRYKDETCILAVAGSRDHVVLPVKEYQWFLDNPDSAVSIDASVAESLQVKYTIIDNDLYHKPAHHYLIPRRLTREVGNLVPDLVDEIRASIDDLWGWQPGETREVCIYTTMQRAIGRVTNRIFVGLPLCRDERLLKNGIAYAQDVPLSSMLLRLPWGPLRPLLALAFTLPNRIHTNRFYALLRDEIRRRLREYDAQQSNPDTEKKAAGSVPNDFLQWSIQQARESSDPYLARVDTLAGRILLLNFAAIHTSSFSITGVLLDLACAGAADGRRYIDELRAEIDEALAAHDGVWTKRSLADMPKLDSVMRESARLNSFVPLASLRVVVAPDGVTTPSGVHLSPGTSIGTHAYPVLHDGSIYPDPESFQPFRFSERRRVETEGGYVEKAKQAFATTSTEYAAFGHGRHACPGRFFASSELKLMLAYVVMNYDFEFQETRPANAWVGVNRIPPMKATVRVKRRTQKVS
ncbi:hypothetical protein M406DRAFT_99177 [Cryphonectria parasitica EP155]|uniref:Cytochrome P450 n=1 Tax=Cryphonectria parasitica (strain ATCC 38755 / EP155) TaxID=660469 RepID=A0A9P4XWX6_CRYP1|nr:uncharacterized protein M406DRAFT_99177 [Cryphonectria parasitica EP155]KAF3762804.1 hypothetical protein M406DRAFT_99177 [Cryphonectria parasitica EP155]